MSCSVQNENAIWCVHVHVHIHSVQRSIINAVCKEIKRQAHMHLEM